MKQVGVIDRSRREGSGKDETVIDINRGMFFEPVKRFVIFDNPVGVKVPGILFWFSVFIEFAFRRIGLFLNSFYPVKLLENPMYYTQCRFLNGFCLKLLVFTYSYVSIKQ